MVNRLNLLLYFASLLFICRAEASAQDSIPVALDDRYSTGINDTLTISPPGVLSNDFNKALNAVKIHGPEHGSVELNTDGSFTYMPETGFIGQDSFTYEANDGSTQSNMATVTVYIHTKAKGYKNSMDEKVNAVPVASEDSITVKEDRTHDEPVPGVLSNDSDPDSAPEPLTADLVRDVSHGSLILHADGSFEYTPERNFFGRDRFTYRPFDGEYYGSETRVQITVDNVNDPPVVINDVLSTWVNTTATGNLLGNDYDPDDDRIRIPSVKEDLTHRGGTVTIDTGGSFTYSPPEDFTGTDQYNYKVSDTGSPPLSSSGTLYISVTDTMDLNTTLIHNTCHGESSGGIDLAVNDYTPGRQALSFNGTNDDVIIPPDASLDITGSITLEAWIRITGRATDKWQVMGRDQQYHLRYEKDELIFYTGEALLTEPIHFSDSVWYHLGATYNRDTMRLYVNGSEIAKRENTTAIQQDAARNFYIGTDNSGERHFEGMIDEVRVWSVARTGEQIRNNMISELTGSETGLEGYWKFNEGSEFTALDASSNSNDGSLSLPKWFDEYDYSWSGPEGFASEAKDIDNLKAGEYTGTVRAANGYSAQTTATIREPDPLMLTEVDSAHRNVSSFGRSDGAFEVDPSGGSGDYEFSIDSGATWVNDSVFTALTAGDYTVYLRDTRDTSCQYTGLGTISLTQPSVFHNCDTLQENNYCYQFWDESYNETDSIPVRYEWSFSDGTQSDGLKVEHCFPGTGTYEVKLNMIDNRTGNVFFTQQEFEFEIKDAVQPFIRSKDAFIKNKEIEFDGLESNLPSVQIENYYWNFGDGTSAKGPKAQHTFKKKGNYRVKLGITGTNDTTGAKENHCVWKEVRVFEDYQALAMYQEEKDKKTDAVSDPEEDPNNELHTEFDAYERNPEEEIFRVQVLSSREKISLQDSVFDPLRDTYEISEYYNDSDSLYSYTVGQRKSLQSIYPVYDNVVDRGFEQAQVKSFIMGELPEKVVNQINKAFSEIDNAQFGFDEYKIAESSYPILDRIVNIMKHNSDIKIEIAAHTDNIGSFGYNMELSRKRAQSIMDYMVSKGISKDRLRAVGYGQSRPIADNQTEEGRQKNRRVEFILIKE
ncbi:MAG: Ig-like domain-containing protein [Bacteroidales bacterium]